MEFHNNFKIEDEVELVFENVHYSLKSMTLKNFPIEYELVKTKKLLRPWIDKTLKKLINKKHLIYKKCKIKLIPFSRYKTYRNVLNKTLNLLKKYTMKENSTT